MAPTSLNSIGARVAHARALAGLDRKTLTALAEFPSPSHVGQIETGRVKHPAADTLTALARVFGVSLDWLVRGTGRAPTARQVLIAVEIARGRVAVPVSVAS